MVYSITMNGKLLGFGWCECGRVWPVRESGGAELPGMQRCLRRFNREVREDEISAAYFEEWVEDVRGRKQWGPSPVERNGYWGADGRTWMPWWKGVCWSATNTNAMGTSLS